MKVKNWLKFENKAVTFQLISAQFLGGFAKLRKATIRLVMSACPSVSLSFCVEQLESYWTDAHEIWYMRVWRLTAGWTVRGSNPGEARFSAPVQTGPGAHPASFTMGTGLFPGVKCGRGVTLTTHTLLVLWSWKSRAIPLPTLWATPGL
jgi:hypothetical protein